MGHCYRIATYFFHHQAIRAKVVSQPKGTKTFGLGASVPAVNGAHPLPREATCAYDFSYSSSSRVCHLPHPFTVSIY